MRKVTRGKFVIGLMSGTSADGVDLALLSVNTIRNFKVIALSTYPYPENIKEAILRNIKSPDFDEIIYLHYALGEFYGECVNRFMYENRIDPEEVLLIASHGQTIRHLPNFKRIGKYTVRGTLQIGELSIIAARTGLLTIGDFRPSHISAGGEGAPLAPFFHRLFFFKGAKSILVVNFGGIINITFMDKNFADAFDVGPGNILIDGVVKRVFGMEYDRDGRISMSGRVKEVAVRKVLAHPYYSKLPPKSTGREEFNEEFVANFVEMFGDGEKEDAVTSACEVCVRSIDNAVSRFIKKKPEKIILCGGGARNRFIFKRMKELFRGSDVKLSDEYGIPVEGVESAGFALMGYCFVKGIPNDPEGVNILGKAVYPAYPYQEEEV